MDPKHSIGPDRIDYKETPGDLTEVHAAIEREHAEPTADVTPIPLWLTALCGFAVAAAGMYLGLFHGGFRGNVFNENDTNPIYLFPMPAGTEKAEVKKVETLAEKGKSVYSTICQACHQAGGVGLPGTFPPLAKSEYVNGSEKRMISIILKGLQGPITVEGKQFTNVMPPQGAVLTDEKIAAVASYVRSSFGNNAPEISVAKVAAARKELESKTDSFTEAQLLQIPADATLPDAGAAAQPATGAAPAAAAAPGATVAPPPTTAGTTPPGAPTAPATVPAPAAAPGAVPALAGGDQMAQGKSIYMTVCMACHQITGAGLFPTFPPLTQSEYVNGSPERFAAMILKGNIGPFTVQGKQYGLVPMPPQELLLSDDKVAAVMTYVRANFGNTAPAVKPDVVAAARKKFAERKTSWTEPELKAWKE
jgi:mono/diheme cytochrome c family protein